MDTLKYSDEELMELVDTDIASILESRGYKHGWYKETEYVGTCKKNAFENVVR